MIKMKTKLFIWPFLVACLALLSCSEDDGPVSTADDSSAPQIYSCSYEVYFAKDILSYADVVIAMKDPVSQTIYRDTISNLQENTPSFYSLTEISYNNVPFIDCKATFTSIPNVINYQLYCNYLMNEEKAASISPQTVLQYKKAGLNITCQKDSNKVVLCNSSGPTGSSSFEIIKRQYDQSPDYFEQLHEGTYPQSDESVQ